MTEVPFHIVHIVFLLFKGLQRTSSVEDAALILTFYSQAEEVDRTRKPGRQAAPVAGQEKAHQKVEGKDAGLLEEGAALELQGRLAAHQPGGEGRRGTPGGGGGCTQGHRAFGKKWSARRGRTWQTGRGRIPEGGERGRLMSHVSCLIAHISCLMAHVSSPTSPCLILFFFW